MPLGRKQAGNERAEVAEKYCKTLKKKKKQPKANIAALESLLSTDVISLGWTAHSFLHLHSEPSLQPLFMFLTHFLVQFDSVFFL